jgi:hypothetical protein
MHLRIIFNATKAEATSKHFDIGFFHKDATGKFMIVVHVSHVNDQKIINFTGNKIAFANPGWLTGYFLGVNLKFLDRCCPRIMQVV